jgi:hypothetical protein
MRWPRAGEPQFDAVVNCPSRCMRSPTPIALSRSTVPARARPRGWSLRVRAAAILEHDRLDAFAVQQMRKQEPGGARADDAYLRAHRLSSFEALLSYPGLAWHGSCAAAACATAVVPCKLGIGSLARGGIRTAAAIAKRLCNNRARGASNAPLFFEGLSAHAAKQ